MFNKVTLAVGFGGLAIIGLGLCYKKRKVSPPKQWKRVGKLKNIFLYPLKSGYRLELQNAICTQFGLQEVRNGDGFQLRDRCLIVYKEADREYRTAGTYPKMVLIRVGVEESNHFIFSAPGMADLRVKIPNLEENHERVFVKIFKKAQVQTIDCGNSASTWLSTYILGQETGLRLGFHDGIFQRNVKTVHDDFFQTYKNFSNSFVGMYAYLSSYLLVNQTSINDLISRTPCSTTNSACFRPNLVIECKNQKPYIEDDWDWIKIGDVIFRNFKPCTRCSYINIHTETGELSRNSEPLKTLKSYRLLKDLKGIDVEGDFPVMGIYIGLMQSGAISVGDEVCVGFD